MSLTSFIESMSITCVSGFIVGTVIVKLSMHGMKKYVAEQKQELKDMAEQWLNSEKGQKALLQIGALIGNGVKTGVGLNAPRGKGGLMGFLAELAGKYFFKDQNQPQQQSNLKTVEGQWQ